MFKEEIMDYDKALIDTIRTGRKKWVCFGAGRYFYDFIKKYCIDSKTLPLPSYVCDNNEKLQGKDVLSIPIVAPNALVKEKIEDCIIVVSMVLPQGILMELHNSLQRHYYRTIPLSQIETYLYYIEHMSKFEKVYNSFVDDKSRHDYKGYLEALLAGVTSFPVLYTANPYWNNDVIKGLSGGDVIVYAGAYDGKHLDRALEENSKIIVHGFEPNKPIFEKLVDKYKGKDNVILHNSGLYHKNTTLYFDNSAELSAMLVEKEKYGKDSPHQLAQLLSVEVMALDQVIKGKVDLIALDIEGSEPEALQGAEKIIQNYKPKLGICVYHRIEHYVQIPLQIIKMDPSYRLYFRQHSMLAHESVVYAI